MFTVSQNGLCQQQQFGVQLERELDHEQILEGKSMHDLLFNKYYSENVSYPLPSPDTPNLYTTQAKYPYL